MIAKSKPKSKSSKHKQEPRKFVHAFLRSPRSIGAVVPSSRKLARNIASLVDIKKPGAVVELGPGTGVVSQALLDAGVPPDRLVLIERNQDFHTLMAAKFSDVRVMCADAADLKQVLASLGVAQVNVIISSLPFLNMPKPVRHAIESAMAEAIGNEGMIIKFTYGPASPISREIRQKYRLAGKRVKIVLANVPPAHVWVYRRQ